MQEIRVASTIDGSAEPSLLFVPEGARRVPLVVGLHTWSANLGNQVDSMLPYAQRLQWALLLPEFRGANLVSNPRAHQACASSLAKQDIIDAVEAVVRCHAEAIDTSKIFLLGGSGGGHMSLAMAGYRPKLWRMVSSWCPITDLIAWHSENPGYVPGIEACCGGTPAQARGEYVKRSPISCVESIAEANVFVYHGKWDKSVPFTHSVNLYNKIVTSRSSARVYLCIFDGGHELHYDTAFESFRKALATEKQDTVTG